MIIIIGFIVLEPILLSTISELTNCSSLTEGSIILALFSRNYVQR